MRSRNSVPASEFSERGCNHVKMRTCRKVGWQYSFAATLTKAARSSERRHRDRRGELGRHAELHDWTHARCLRPKRLGTQNLLTSGASRPIGQRRRSTGATSANCHTSRTNGSFLPSVHGLASPTAPILTVVCLQVVCLHVAIVVTCRCRCPFQGNGGTACSALLCWQGSRVVIGRIQVSCPRC